LWKLDSGERVFLARGFEGALFEHDQLITKFAKDPPNPSRVFQFDLAAKTNKKLFDISEGNFLHMSSWQWDSLLVTLRPEKEKQGIERGHTLLQVYDVHNNNLLWDRKINRGLPKLFYTPSAVTMLIWDWDGIKEAAKDNPELVEKLSRIENKDTSYLLQAFEPRTGKLLGSVLVDTGKLSFRVSAGMAAGNKMFVTDSNNRTLVYSLRNGAQEGSLIGYVAAASPTGDKVLIQNESGVADLYDTATLHSLSHFNFPARIVEADFAADGSLYILTADQNVYQLDVQAAQQLAAQ